LIIVYLISVTVVEATVNEITWCQDGVRATGVNCTLRKDYSSRAALTEGEDTSPPGTPTHFKAPIVVVADGCFSKFRKQFIPKTVETTSHFVG